MRQSVNASGNVLFLILIAIALFAALSYAVTSTTSGTPSSITDDEAKLQANALVQYGVHAKFAFDRVRVDDRCDVYIITNNELFGSPQHFPGPCNMRDTKTGGGFSFSSVGEQAYGDYTNPPHPGKNTRLLNSMRVIGVGTPKSEMLFLVFNIKQELCRGINLLGKIDMSNGIPKEETPYEGGWSSPYSSNNSTVGGLTIGNTSPVLHGKRFGCYAAGRSGSDMGYHFYYVLLEN